MAKTIFDRWMENLDSIAESEGFELAEPVMSEANIAYWKSLYDEGLSPQEAWDQTPAE